MTDNFVNLPRRRARPAEKRGHPLGLVMALPLAALLAIALGAAALLA